jgi:hypothetical protein
LQERNTEAILTSGGYVYFAFHKPLHKNRIGDKEKSYMGVRKTWMEEFQTDEMKLRTAKNPEVNNKLFKEVSKIIKTRQRYSCDVMPGSLAKFCHCFGRKYCLHFQGCSDE